MFIYMWNRPLTFGFILAVIDLFVLSSLKLHFTGQIHSNIVFPIAAIIYGIQPLIFYRSLAYANMINMNFMWDVASDILVGMVGYWIFKEILTKTQMVGVGLGLVSLWLLK